MNRHPQCRETCTVVTDFSTHFSRQVLLPLEYPCGHHGHKHIENNMRLAPVITNRLAVKTARRNLSNQGQGACFENIEQYNEGCTLDVKNTKSKWFNIT